MAGNVSKNAHREGAKVLMSRWGGAIKMKSVFENGKLRHVAYCKKAKRLNVIFKLMRLTCTAEYRFFIFRIS